MAGSCLINPRLNVRELRLELASDGTPATATKLGCRLLLFELGTERIVPFAVGRPTGGSPDRRFARDVISVYEDLGALAGTNGTFFNDDTPPYPPLGPIVGVDWQTTDRLAQFKTSGTSSHNRWCLDCTRSATGLHFQIKNDLDAKPPDLLTRFGGGFLFLHPSQYQDAGGNNIVPVMATTPLPIADADLAAYKIKFTALNHGTSWWIGKKQDPRVGVGKTSAGTWYLFTVLAAEPDIDTGTDAGYRIVDLAVDLFNNHSFTEAVIFDGSSPFQLARFDASGTVKWKQWGDTRQASSSAWMLTAPRQIQWDSIAGHAPTPQRPTTDVILTPPPSPGDDLQIDLSIVNMSVFGDAHQVHMELGPGGPTLAPQDVIWGSAATEPASFTFTNAQVRSVGIPFTLEARTTDSTGYEIDCSRVRVRVPGRRLWAYVVDDSGSMAGNDPGFLAVAAVSRLIGTLFRRQEDDVAANVVRFSDAPDSLTGGMTVDYALALDAARTGNFSHAGGTDITAALRAAINDFGAGSAWEERGIVLLTDGEDPNFDESVIAEAVASGVRVHALGLGAGTQTELLQRIASGTAGTHQHASDIQELLTLLGTLDGELSTEQLVASVELTPGSASRLVMAGASLTATLTASVPLDLGSTHLTAPDGTILTLAALVADPDLAPGVRVVVDTDPEQGRYVTVTLDGEAAAQGNWQIASDGVATTLIVTEDAPPTERHDLTISGLPEPPNLSASDDSFAFEIAWDVSGEPANPAFVQAALIGPTGTHPIELNQAALGIFSAAVDPSGLGFEAGTYRLTVVAWAQAGTHQRTLSRTLTVYTPLDMDFGDLPDQAVAEESLEHQVRIPAEAANAIVTLRIDDGESPRTVQLSYQGQQDGDSVFTGSLDLGPVRPTRSGVIQVDAYRGSSFASASEDIHILGSRGGWVRTGLSTTALDLAARTYGEVRVDTSLEVLASKMDGFNSSLWQAVKAHSSSMILLRNHDRRGRQQHEMELRSTELHRLDAYDDYVATIEIVEEGGNRESKLFIYHPDLGGAYVEHPGWPTLLFMRGAADVVYTDRIPQDPVHMRVMRVLGVTEPEEIGTYNPSRSSIHVMPDGVVAVWLGQFQPLRRLDDLTKELSPKLDGQTVETDAFGFWLVSNTQGLVRYERQDPSSPYEPTVVDLPGPYRYVELIASSRQAGVALAVNNRNRDNLMLVRGSAVTAIRHGKYITGIQASQSFFDGYPPISSDPNAASEAIGHDSSDE